jgi:hypothetical protein
VKAKEQSRRHHSLSSLRLAGRRLCSLWAFPHSRKHLGHQPRAQVALALTLWFLFFATNAFAMFKPPYPQKAEPPGQIIVISDGGADSIAGTATKPK